MQRTLIMRQISSLTAEWISSWLCFDSNADNETIHLGTQAHQMQLLYHSQAFSKWKIRSLFLFIFALSTFGSKKTQSI